jgi:hypothetical protein
MLKIITYNLNCQFDFWPLKFKNRPNPGACRWNATHRWKDLEESYNFGLDLVPIRTQGEKSKVPRVQTRIVSKFHFRSPGIKSHLDASAAESCEEFLHTFAIKICTHKKKTGRKWNYYVVVILISRAIQGK